MAETYFAFSLISQERTNTSRLCLWCEISELSEKRGAMTMTTDAPRFVVLTTTLDEDRCWLVWDRDRAAAAQGLSPRTRRAAGS